MCGTLVSAAENHHPTSILVKFAGKFWVIGIIATDNCARSLQPTHCCHGSKGHLQPLITQPRTTTREERWSIELAVELATEFLLKCFLAPPWRWHHVDARIPGTKGAHSIPPAGGDFPLQTVANKDAHKGSWVLSLGEHADKHTNWLFSLPTIWHSNSSKTTS